MYKYSHIIWKTIFSCSQMVLRRTIVVAPLNLAPSLCDLLRSSLALLTRPIYPIFILHVLNLDHPHDHHAKQPSTKCIQHREGECLVGLQDHLRTPLFADAEFLFLSLSPPSHPHPPLQISKTLFVIFAVHMMVARLTLLCMDQ